MIYTIGHLESYREARREKGEVVKMGLRAGDPYVGGYVFRTLDDAKRRIAEAYEGRGFEAFGLDAVWGKDTYPSPRGWWHNLKYDARVIFLDEPEGAMKHLGEELVLALHLEDIVSWLNKWLLKIYRRRNER